MHWAPECLAEGAGAQSVPAAAGGAASREQHVCADPTEPHQEAQREVTDTIEIPPNQASRGGTTRPCSPGARACTLTLGSCPAL